MQKIKETNTPYVLFIDEVDFVDSGEGTKKNECIHYLKNNAHCVFGVSATVMDPIGKEYIRINDIILLSAPNGYKGITSIQVEHINESAVYTGKTTDNLFKTDKGLASFVVGFSKKKAFVYADGFVHPQICLVNICRTKEPTMMAQEKLSKRFPSMIIVVYNGDGITYTFRNKKKDFKGTISSFLQTIKDKFEIFIEDFTEISEKQNKLPNIIIFSGDLAGRGISFTSSDFGWHLTSMRLLVAPNCDEPELIQRVRLCGIYKDDIPLTLYSTPAILEDIRKAYFRQEEIICFLKKKQHEKLDISCKELIESLDINNDKFSKRNPVKDRFDIKPKAEGNSLVVKWPKAHEISNGQRDILTFIALLLKSRRNFKKQDCILVIDEIFDYMDDANLITFQYYISTFIDEMKRQKRRIFPILLTHLDPLFFNHFCFNDTKIKVNYLKEVNIK